MYEDVHALFPVTVALNLVNNYFFFAGQIVFLFIYFFAKLSCRDYRIRRPKKFFLLAFESLLGVAMGCVLLWPAALSLMDNPRTVDVSNGFGLLLYGRVQQYFAIFTSLFLPPDPTYLPNIFTDAVIKHTSMTAYLPVVGFVGGMAYLRCREKTPWKRILLVCFLMAMVPVLNLSLIHIWKALRRPARFAPRRRCFQYAAGWQFPAPRRRTDSVPARWRRCSLTKAGVRPLPQRHRCV